MKAGQYERILYSRQIVIKKMKLDRSSVYEGISYENYPEVLEFQKRKTGTSQNES